MPNIEECCRCPGCGVCKANDILRRMIEQLREHTLPGSGISLHDQIFDLMSEGTRHLETLK